MVCLPRFIHTISTHMPLKIGKTAKPYDMTKAKEKPSLRGLFSTMIVKPSEKSEKGYEDEPMEEMEGMEEEEMSKEEHAQMAMEEASAVRSALESEDMESAMSALDKLESHLEKCVA